MAGKVPESGRTLSGRERQILGLAASGMLDKNIAFELNISLNTLRTYWQRIRQKCGSVPRAALTASFVKGELYVGGAQVNVPGSTVALNSTEDPITLRRAAIYYATALERAQDSLRMVDRACRVLSSYRREALRQIANWSSADSSAAS